MKKLISVFLAVLLTLCVSVPSFAYYTGTIPGMTIEGEDAHIKTIITSTLTEKQKDFMRSWFAGGGAGKKTMLLYQNYSVQQHDLTFYIVPAGANLIRLNDGGSAGSPLKRYQFTSNISCIYFRYDNSSGTYKFLLFSENEEAILVPAARIAGSFNHSLLDPEFQLDIVNCYIDDDDGLLEDSSSSSEPTEPPAPPYDPSPGPSMPSPGGSDSPYIPYDPAVWWEAVSFIRSGAGAAGNILFLILAPIVLVGMAFFFIRHYSSGGKGGGGGTAI